VAVLRFRLIAEADARQIEHGTTVELEAGGHVTPLAMDTLRAKRVTVVPAGTVDASLPADLAPVPVITRMAVGADHTGVALKRALVGHLRQAGLAVTEYGADDDSPVDYPDVAAAVARAVVRLEVDAGIVIDGAGLGSAIAANKVRGARAAMCTTPTLARYAREHNGANVLAIGATLVSAAEAREIVDTWRSTPMREPRYLRRLLKVRRLEERF
jgi:ribose 5-phosphate isomerase B